MARKSMAALAVASLETASRRLKPPADLPEPCRAIWRELVDSLPPDRFHASDRPLLVLYTRALHQAELAYEALEQYGAAADDSVSPWQRVADSAVKQAATLATKLRLCPLSRMDRKVAGPAARGGDAPRPWASSEVGHDEI